MRKRGAREFGECMTNIAPFKKGNVTIGHRYTVFGKKKKLLDFVILNNGRRLPSVK
jgi:hypothetical protein